jgi:hypothetical protein
LPGTWTALYTSETIHVNPVIPRHLIEPKSNALCLKYALTLRTVSRGTVLPPWQQTLRVCTASRPRLWHETGAPALVVGTESTISDTC